MKFYWGTESSASRWREKADVTGKMEELTPLTVGSLIFRSSCVLLAIQLNEWRGTHIKLRKSSIINADDSTNVLQIIIVIYSK